MKKLIGVLSVALLLLVLLPGTSEAQIRFGFKGYGGLNYLSGGDFNQGAQGFSEAWTDLLAGANPEGEFKPVHLGMNFGGEMLLQFTPSMGFGLGVGYISAATSSEIEYTPATSGIEFTWDANVSAIPITATFYYFLPSAGNLKIFVNAGVGYYLAKVDFEHAFWFILPINWDAETTGGGIGFHGGLGLEYGLSPMFGIVAEVKGRYAAFSNFEGSVDWTFPGWSSTVDTEEGKLWAFKTGDYTWLWISESEPSGSDQRQAKVDFSGFSFLVGFIARF
jgi:hypothetical protein